jgi:predicted alpha/beta-fold hydrolase
LEIAGDSNDAFVKWICMAFYKLGWRAVSFNYRCLPSIYTTAAMSIRQSQCALPQAQTTHSLLRLAKTRVWGGRGCGGVPLTTPKIFCQADTSDIYESVKEIRSQFPRAPIFAAGFSLGGYTLNKYIGQVDTGVYGPGQPFFPTT